MALTIKDEQTEKLARELARRTGETLTVAIRTFDTATLRSQRRIYVELTVRGNDGGGELFRMEWARPTHPVGATATAKRGPHLVEIADAIAAALPAPRTVPAPAFRKD